MSAEPRKRRRPGPEPIASERRRARRRAKLPPDAACTYCGWQTPDALLQVGVGLVQGDHVDGAAHHPTLIAPLCPNHHAVRTEGQRRLGVDLHRDDGRSLLETRAAGLRSRVAFHRDLAWAEAEEADRLAALAAALDERFPGWRELPEARA
jgi:hypothetical protein